MNTLPDPVGVNYEAASYEADYHKTADLVLPLANDCFNMEKFCVFITILHPPLM